MKAWIIAATALMPAFALATPMTFASSSQGAGKAAGKTVKVTGKVTSANGGSQGKAVAGDVTLGGISASQLVYGAGINPQQGPNGNTSGFAGAFSASGAGDWASLAKFAAAPDSVEGKLGGLALTMAFGLTDLRHGTWSISNTDTHSDLSFDLTFAMHTGGGSGSWLFDNYLLQAGSTAQGSWSLNLLNPGGQLGDYSNLTLFVRNATATAAALDGAPVPAPADQVVEVALAELIDALQQHAGDIHHGDALLESKFDPVGFPQSGGATDIPEPGSLAMFLAGAGTLALHRRRKRAAPV